MLAIPLPFIMSFLLVAVALLVKVKQPREGKLPAIFICLCALSTFIVGLRWSFDVSFLRFIQPILASLIPMTAWFCFDRAHKLKPSVGHSYLVHLLGPITVGFSAYFYYIWLEMADLLLVSLYVIYGLLLLKSSFNMPEEVRLSQVDSLLNAERIAALVLLVSGAIDAVLALDFIYYEGRHASWMLSLSYLVLIPLVVAAVLYIGFATSLAPTLVDEENGIKEVNVKKGISKPEQKPEVIALEEKDAREILANLDQLMREKEAFRDPDLTLSRLSRKLGIPARQISMAVNQICQQNISKVLNEYRIEFAKHQLMHSHDTIMDIYLASGFQTKSNFNREFSRITQQTPSEFRRTATGD